MLNVEKTKWVSTANKKLGLNIAMSFYFDSECSSPSEFSGVSYFVKSGNQMFPLLKNGNKKYIILNRIARTWITLRSRDIKNGEIGKESGG